jgi:DNA end-binding protein Ku
MPRPIWKGSISFGLVNIPVVLYPAERRSDISFHMLDRRNEARVRYQRVNEATGEEVPWEEIVKAYEDESGNYVVLSDEDFEKAAVESTQMIEIEDFVDRDEIKYVYYDKPYYLVPAQKGEKGYVLLREALKRTDKAGITKVVIRTKQYLGAVMAEGDALILEILRFQDEIRPEEEYDFPRQGVKHYKLSPRELEMAETLVETLAADWKPEKYHDDYREKLIEFIEEKKARGGESPPAKEEPAKGKKAEVVDMMELLRQSVETRAKKKRAAAPAKKRTAAKKAARKRRAA